VRDRGNGLKVQPVVYRWMNRAGWVIPTSYEVMRMKAVNLKPMNRPKGTPALKGGEEVSVGEAMSMYIQRSRQRAYEGHYIYVTDDRVLWWAI